jgi:hypothetical protein
MAKKTDTEALCRELLTIRRKHADVFDREKEVKSQLTAAAGEKGENLKITIEDLGIVKVSAPKEKRRTGTAPEIVVEAFLRLPERERKDLMKRGLVAEVEQWKSAYYGSVTAELF